MKQFALLALVVLAACEVNDKTGEVQPKPATQTATAAAKQEAKELGEKVKATAQEVQESEAGQRIAAGAREAGEGIKQGAGEAVEAAGETLAEKGRQIKEDAKKKDAAPPKTQT